MMHPIHRRAPIHQDLYRAGHISELGEVAAMHRSDGIAGWHWWTLAEMDSTTEVIWSPRLADLVRGLLG
jgi:hypothetical protein